MSADNSGESNSHPERTDDPSVEQSAHRQHLSGETGKAMPESLSNNSTHHEASRGEKTVNGIQLAILLAGSGLNAAGAAADVPARPNYHDTSHTIESRQVDRPTSEPTYSLHLADGSTVDVNTSPWKSDLHSAGNRPNTDHHAGPVAADRDVVRRDGPTNPGSSLLPGDGDAIEAEKQKQRDDKDQENGNRDHRRHRDEPTPDQKAQASGNFWESHYGRERPR